MEDLIFSPQIGGDLTQFGGPRMPGRYYTTSVGYRSGSKGIDEPIDNRPRTTAADVAAVGLQAGSKAYNVHENYQKHLLESSGLQTSPELTFQMPNVGGGDLAMSPHRNIFVPKKGFHVGRFSKRYGVDPAYYEAMTSGDSPAFASKFDLEKDLVEKLKTKDFSDKQITVDK